MCIVIFLSQIHSLPFSCLQCSRELHFPGYFATGLKIQPMGDTRGRQAGRKREKPGYFSPLSSPWAASPASVASPASPPWFKFLLADSGFQVPIILPLPLSLQPEGCQQLPTVTNLWVANLCITSLCPVWLFGSSRAYEVSFLD